MKEHNPEYTPLVCDCRKCIELADMVGTYMEANVQWHVSSETLEVNCTALAEDAARNFSLYDGDAPQEWLFDLAVDVADIYEASITEKENKEGRCHVCRHLLLECVCE